MGVVADGRKRVLERIKNATRAAAGATIGGSAARNAGAPAGTAAGAHSDIPRGYVRRGDMTVRGRHERFIERLREYDAEVVECEPDGLAAAIAAQLKASGRHLFVAPEGLPAEWLAPGFEWKIDGNLEIRDVERAEGVVTACFCGVADSGTIVLHHGPAEGRRVITLLPDWYLCVVRASQVVETLPEYFDKCREQGTGDREQKAGTLPRLVTWISGPSATADIEMTRIKGVHGPRFLNVILVKD
jgi:L-lactate dehydrogenase complex protein LldG